MSIRDFVIWIFADIGRKTVSIWLGFLPSSEEKWSVLTWIFCRHRQKSGIQIVPID